MNILVFKTNIRYKKHLSEIVHYLNSTSGILRWNVDFQDKDKILRIEANNLHPQSVEKVLQRAGYYCEELQD
jgi:hypothetical protein